MDLEFDQEIAPSHNISGWKSTDTRLKFYMRTIEDKINQRYDEGNRQKIDERLRN